LIVAAWGDDDGQTPAPGDNRVLRGANWNNNAQNCGSANRSNNNPDEQAICPVTARAGRR
jgi:formylglycine-generating enzyme required for sulfatase activity